ncbi:MAG: GNAT family N-acetyltransferase [Rhodothermales bacterium]
MQELVDIQEVEFEQLDTIRLLNVTIFEEERVINTFDREDLLMLIAYQGAEPIGFKIGYRLNDETFYSAKGGVLAAYRRKGVARLMLYDMIARVKKKGYTGFAYDTFPNKDPGMTILGLHEGFQVVKADFNTVFQDYRLQFQKHI